jgi:hypothetical protein
MAPLLSCGLGIQLSILTQETLNHWSAQGYDEESLNEYKRNMSLFGSPICISAVIPTVVVKHSSLIWENEASASVSWYIRRAAPFLSWSRLSIVWFVGLKFSFIGYLLITFNPDLKLRVTTVASCQLLDHHEWSQWTRSWCWRKSHRKSSEMFSITILSIECGIIKRSWKY